MTEDLDALAVEPLLVHINGRDIDVTVTVDTMMRVAQLADTEPGANNPVPIIMEACGMPPEEFGRLQLAQVRRLTELISERFFGGGSVTEAAAAGPSVGPTPSSPTDSTPEAAKP